MHKKPLQMTSVFDLADKDDRVLVLNPALSSMHVNIVQSSRIGAGFKTTKYN